MGRLPKLTGVQQARGAVSGGESGNWLTAFLWRLPRPLRPAALGAPGTSFARPSFGRILPRSLEMQCTTSGVHSSLGSVVLLAVAMQAAVLMAQMHVHAHAHGGAHLYAAARAGHGLGARAWGKSVVAFACRAVEPRCLSAGRAARSSSRLPDVLVAGCGGFRLAAGPGRGFLEALRHRAVTPLRVVDRVPARAGANFQARAPPVV